MRDPYMVPYIFGNRSGVDIIDIDKVNIIDKVIYYKVKAIIILCRNERGFN